MRFECSKEGESKCKYGTADRWQRCSLNRARSKAAVIVLNFINGTRKMVIGVCVRCALKFCRLYSRVCLCVRMLPWKAHTRSIVVSVLFGV